ADCATRWWRMPRLSPHGPKARPVPLRSWFCTFIFVSIVSLTVVLMMWSGPPRVQGFGAFDGAALGLTFSVGHRQYSSPEQSSPPTVSFTAVSFPFSRSGFDA